MIIVVSRTVCKPPLTFLQGISPISWNLLLFPNDLSIWFTPDHHRRTPRLLLRNDHRFLLLLRRIKDNCVISIPPGKMEPSNDLPTGGVEFPPHDTWPHSKRSMFVTSALTSWSLTISKASIPRPFSGRGRDLSLRAPSRTERSPETRRGGVVTHG